jgi:hypothetical protein
LTSQCRWVRANAETIICDKCTALDRKIAHYLRLEISILDQVTVDRLKELLRGLIAEKAALHRAQEQ